MMFRRRRPPGGGDAAAAPTDFSSVPPDLRESVVDKVHLRSVEEEEEEEEEDVYPAPVGGVDGMGKVTSSTSRSSPVRRAVRHALALILSVPLYNVLLSTIEYEGKPRGSNVPPEAVPIYAHPDMSWANMAFEYAFPLIAPIGAMIGCPIANPDPECMSAVRDGLRRADEMSWPGLIRGLGGEYVEEAVYIDRPGDGDESAGDPPLEVVLLMPRDLKNSSVPAAPPPLILYMHGGGFAVGGPRDGQYVPNLALGLRGRSDAHPAAGGAVWASVGYRLAPEYPYPAAPDDCHLALTHLLGEYPPLSGGARLGDGGVHVAGVSAGATLATMTALRALRGGIRVDSMFLDAPVFPVSSGTGGGESSSLCGMDRFLEGSCSPLDTPSYRRNAYTRIPPHGFLDWALHAYTGCPPASEEVSPEVRERLCRGGGDDTDYVGGAASPDEWSAARRGAPGGRLPGAVLLSAKADMLRDLAEPFVDAYTEASAAGGGERAELVRVEARSSHAMAFMFDPDAGGRAVDAWGGMIQRAADAAATL